MHVTCSYVSPLKEVILQHPEDSVSFTKAVAQGGKLNLALSLKPLEIRGISPDLPAGTLAIPFSRSFLLLHAGIFRWLFLKLPICSGSSWGGVPFLFHAQPPLPVTHSLCDQIALHY